MEKSRLIVLMTALLSVTSAAGVQSAVAADVHGDGAVLASAADSYTIGGKVLAKDNTPITGATIVSVNSPEHYAVSDSEGNFTIRNAQSGEVFEVSFLGYKSVKFTVGTRTDYSIVLESDDITMDEVVVVGYGVQKKATVTGSVASVTGNELVKTKNSNVQNMLTGRIPGLRVVQRSSEPGTFDMGFNIRGFGGPLVIIDGVPRGTLSRLDPNEIESISVLKDASAAVYGVQAANGVILVTTKSGNKDGKVNVSYNGNMTWQMVSGLPETVGMIDYMKMSNEKSLTSVSGNGVPVFSEEEMAPYLSGEKVGTDWYGSSIRKFSPQTQHNVSISGGNSKTSYFVNMGYQYQEGIFSTGDLRYDRYNLRTKLKTQLSKSLTLDVNLAAILDKKHAPRISSDDIIRALWKQFPYDPVYANDTAPYYYQVSVDEGLNPLALMNTDYSGYSENQHKWFQGSMALEWKLPFVKGMSMKAFYSYDYNFSNNKTYRRSYNLYRFDELNQQYVPTVKDAPSSVNRFFDDGMKTVYQFSVAYDRTFADAHSVKGMLLLEGQKNKDDNFYAQRELSLDIDQLFAGNSENQQGGMYTNKLGEDARMGLVGRFNYDYKGKYLMEFLFRYDGSSRFRKDNRWGFFPSISAGYRISEESFWKDSWFKFINNLKFRVSYGTMGNDAALAYQFLTGYRYPDGQIFFDGKPVNGVINLGIPNPYITWTTVHTFNTGIDFEAWNGKLGITFDYFQRKRDGLLATRNVTLPGTVGANMPQENLNSDKQFGFELELSHRYRVSEDFFYSIKGNVAVTRSKNCYREESEQRSNWHYWRNSNSGRLQNIWWGIGKGGQYQNFDQIAESPLLTGTGTLPGDYFYEDWNGDGFIDDMDKHPIGYNTQPLLNFGINFDISWKGIDFSMLWQGAAMSNVAYTERLKEPLENIFPPLDFFLDRWRPAVEGSNPYRYDTEWIPGKYPSMGGGKVIGHSRFNVHNGAYMRLKNIELGYTLPKKWMDKIGIESMRFYLSGYNLLTFSELDFVDPEHPSDNHGYMYPLNKTITVGLNMKF